MMLLQATARSAAVSAGRLVTNHRPLSTRVNDFDLADTLPPLPRPAYEMACGEVSQSHWDADWSVEEIQSASQDNGMFTWGASDPARAGAPLIQRGEGVYVYVAAHAHPRHKLIPGIVLERLIVAAGPRRQAVPGLDKSGGVHKSGLHRSGAGTGGGDEAAGYTAVCVRRNGHDGAAGAAVQASG